LSSVETTTRGSRARAVKDWLTGRGDTSLGRLSLQWFRGYFAAVPPRSTEASKAPGSNARSPTAASPFFLAGPLNANGKTFGAFGVVVTFIGYVFVMITMSLMCAVFSPVWANWRRTEKDRRADESPAGS